MMKLLLKLMFLVFIFSLVSFSSSIIPSNYSINASNIEALRTNPVMSEKLLKMIENHPDFMHTNTDVNDGFSVEYYLLDELKKDGFTTFVVFEYFFREGVSSDIQALTINDKDELISTIRLAQYEEYPDGKLTEYSEMDGNTLIRTTLLKGIKSYNDSLNQLIMKSDSTVTTFNLNDFQRIEQVNSTFTGVEYLEPTN